MIFEGQTGELFLGIEGGGTRTVALVADGRGQVVRRVEIGPANLKLLTDSQLVGHLRSLAKALPKPCALAVGLAGAWAEADRKRVRNAAARVWRGIPCLATSDLEIALKAAQGQTASASSLRILVVCGTGSCCYGQSLDGKRLKVGGWGHVLGDKGSGYEIGLRGLKAVVYYYDRDGTWPKLGERLLRTLQLNEPDDLIGWAQAASKAEIARLAVDVFASWSQGDKIAADILAAAANTLAQDAATCARRLSRRGTTVQFFLAGSILLKEPRFASRVRRELRKLWPGAAAVPLQREGVWGAVALAMDLKRTGRLDGGQGLLPEQRIPPGVRSARMSPTEERNAGSMMLDKMSIGKAVALMLREEAKVPARVRAESQPIEEAVHAIVRTFRRGGRLFYVGAGTSGRLGVLDASECPATFRTPPDLVQGIIAGGQVALWKAVEGAEDDVLAGARAIQFRNVDRRDIVVGIAASGTTPFVWGALGEAKKRGATTVLVCFNPFLVIAPGMRPTIVIAPNLGAELLTGSTRLKAGTATKLILNIFTTLAMVQTGKVVSNLMTDLLPANAKLRDRATRIVQELTRVDYDRARLALKRNGWVIAKAVARLAGK